MKSLICFTRDTTRQSLFHFYSHGINNMESFHTLFYHCLHTNHLPSLPLIWTKFEDSHHNAMIITPRFLRNKIICYISPTIQKYENTWENFYPTEYTTPPPYPCLATLKIVQGMRVLFGTKATVYGKQSGSYGLQQIYTQPSPIKNDVS